MEQELICHPIAHIASDFPTKFGIPRQSGLVDALQASVIFEPPYRDINALRGLDAFSHIWLIWEFSASGRDRWSPTVKPPRLGGNARMGVFATRSPFRPNPIGLSCVKLSGIDWNTPQGPILHIRGADLMDQTPILDIKPYIPYADAHPDAAQGFTSRNRDYTLQVDIAPRYQQLLSPQQLQTLTGVLAQDPRPSYQNDPQRIYGFFFADFEVRFTVQGTCLTVVDVTPKP